MNKHHKASLLPEDEGTIHYVTLPPVSADKRLQPDPERGPAGGAAARLSAGVGQRAGRPQQAVRHAGLLGQHPAGAAGQPLPLKRGTFRRIPISRSQ